MADEILEIFSEETQEHLQALEKGLLDLEKSKDIEQREELIHSLFRHAHTIKGDARAVGVPTLQESAQSLEDHLDKLRDNPETLETGALNEGLSLFDQVQNTFKAWLGWEEESIDEPAVIPEIKSGPDSDPEPEPARPRPAPEVTSANEDTFTVRVHSAHLDQLMNTAGELRTSQRSQSSVMGQLGDLSGFLSQILRGVKGLDRSHASGNGTTETTNHLRDIRQHIEGALDQVRQVQGQLRKGGNRQEILLDALENEIRDIRLLPLSTLIDSFHRPLRDLAHELGKSMSFRVDVGNVQLDKGVLETLKAPMLHLLRNAVDHGLESPEERAATGKQPEGRIEVRAKRSKTRVEISIHDDGRGIDFERIRQKLRSRGDLEESAIANLTPDALAKFLFQPGFSTRKTLTMISGRGVGLDVVRNSVQQLRGTITINPNEESGTTFLLTVPVTISTLRILTVFSGGHYYGIPGHFVQRLGRAKRSEITILGGSLVLKTDHGPIPWIPLGDVLGQPTTLSPHQQEAVPYLLIRQGESHVALAVEDCEDEIEILLKPLEFPLQDMHGVLGATTRPDGSVQLILDVQHMRLTGSRARSYTNVEMEKPKPRILLADDSPTTRTILRNVFVAAGYQVRTARDGVEALERLRASTADLVVSDVEMPRMDGFELTREIKRSFEIPVILVTGLEKEPHRRKGLEAGADAYIVKSSFEGEGLLDVVRQFVG